jgi:CHASE2 domain-containing sensor protein
MAMGDHTNSPKRVAISNRCAAAGVFLLLMAGLFPAHWYPVVPLFLGLALVAVAHVLAPCEDRIAVWRKDRASKKELPSNPTIERDARKSGARPSL